MRVARRAKSRTASSTRTQHPNRNDSALAGRSRKATYTVGRTYERRAYVRARLALPVSVCRVAGQSSSRPPALRTKDISSSGAFFLYPQRIEPGTPLTIEVSLIEDRPRHRAVRMYTEAHVVRAEAAGKLGWHGLAVAFDDIRYVRNEHLMARSESAEALPSA